MDQNQSKDQAQIELLIDERIAKAKLDIAEKRLQFTIRIAGAALALFGVLIPVFLSNRATDRVDTAIAQMQNQSTEAQRILRNDIQSAQVDFRAHLETQSHEALSTNAKVDQAIQKMQHDFKELAGTQLRKPTLECLLNRTNLEGNTLSLYPNQQSETIEIRNTGDGTARNIRIRVYTNSKEGISPNLGDFEWRQLNVADEPGYKFVYETYQPFQFIDPKESRSIDLGFMFGELQPPITFGCLMKVFYEQPEPRRYVFTVSYSKEK